MKVAIIGVSGAVGMQILKDLENSNIKNIEPILIASKKSEGKKFVFRGKSYTTITWHKEVTIDTKYCLMSAGSDFSKKNAETIAEKGCIVIDNSSAWRKHNNVPLIVPEVNKHKLKNFTQGIIANPNCCVIPMMLVLYPLHKMFGLKRVIVSTYQSVSGSGQKGITELKQQNIDINTNKSFVCKEYPAPIAGNILPLIGKIDASGYCEEELKIIFETQKILDNKQLKILPTTVRVPIVRCHSESITVEFSKKVSSQHVYSCLSEQNGLAVGDGDESIFFKGTPLAVVGKSKVYVDRIRSLYGEKTSKWFNIWCVADNLKKGAATNAVQIFEFLAKSHIKKTP